MRIIKDNVLHLAAMRETPSVLQFLLQNLEPELVNNFLWDKKNGDNRLPIECSKTSETYEILKARMLDTAANTGIDYSNRHHNKENHDCKNECNYSYCDDADASFFSIDLNSAIMSHNFVCNEMPDQSVLGEIYKNPEEFYKYYKNN